MNSNRLLDLKSGLGRFAVVWMVAIAVVLVACNGEEADEPTETPSSTTVATSPTAGATESPEATGTPDATETPGSTPETSPTASSSPTAVASPTPQATGTAAATSTPGGTAGAALIEVGDGGELGDILVDGEGMTLYIFDNDEEGVSNCSGGCLTAWPPLLTEGDPEAGEGVTAELGTITRDDGTTQVTVNGFPAYYFQNDAAPGDTTGQGRNDVWWVFGPDGEAKRPAQVAVMEHDELGMILTDGNGRTIYIFDNDEEGVSNCSGGCLNAWPPLLTTGEPTALEGVTAEVGTITRDDGTTQVTINGFPAYYWQNDAEPGEATGHGVNNVWWVFGPDGEPLRPAKVGIAEHDTLGTILVDGNGMTLYLFDNDEEGVSNCSGGCLTAWPPLLTEFDPVALEGVNAELGTITRDDGTMQVTVNGMPVYYWQNDAEAGDATGQGVNDVWWVMDADGEAVRN